MSNGSNGQGLATFIPLVFPKGLKPESTWAELMESLRGAKYFGDIEAILRRGFDVPMALGDEMPSYGFPDVVEFYFAVADNWLDEDERPADEPCNRNPKTYFIRDENGKRVQWTSGEFKTRLAGVAFEMLSQRFFNAKLRNEENVRAGRFSSVWLEVVFSEQLFPVIQNFFRFDQEKKSNSCVRLRNLSSDGPDSSRTANAETASNFLLNLTRVVWEWKVEEIPRRWIRSRSREKSGRHAISNGCGKTMDD